MGILSNKPTLARRKSNQEVGPPLPKKKKGKRKQTGGTNLHTKRK